jgi:flagellar biosynthesis/type III secretory pathway protein FliH
MNRNENVYETDSSNSEVELLVQQMSENEAKSREELEKKYVSANDRETRSFEDGFAEGIRVGMELGYAAGWDAALKEAKSEEAT